MSSVSMSENVIGEGFHYADQTEVHRSSLIFVERYPGQNKQQGMEATLAEFQCSSSPPLSTTSDGYDPDTPSVSNLETRLSITADSSSIPPIMHDKFIRSRNLACTFSATQQTADVYEKRRLDVETNLISFVCNDNAEGLVNAVQQMAPGVKVDDTAYANSKLNHFNSILSYWFPHRLLHLACQLDSVTCAKALVEGETGMSCPVNTGDECGKTALHHAAGTHSVRCIDLLLRKHAKIDIRSKEGLLPLDAALENKRFQLIDWRSFTVNELLLIIRQQDLTAVKILAGHTKDALSKACHLAFDGKIVALAVFLLAAANDLHLHDQRYETFLGIVVDKAISSGAGRRSNTDLLEDIPAGARDSILRSLEIILRLKGNFGIKGGSPSNVAQGLHGKKPSALLRAIQAGDEAVAALLLDSGMNPNETDSDGNTALHWCFRTNPGTDQALRLVRLLLPHGSAVNARNRLGLTPVHVAAGQGKLQALQVLLDCCPEAVHIAAETMETPLYFAARNNHIECAKLLLQFGASRHVFNLRRQRPIDVANSQDMRTLLFQDEGYISGRAKDCSDLKFFTSHLASDDSGFLYGSHKFDDDSRISDYQDDSEEAFTDALQKGQAKTVLCRYYKLPGGCVRGERCFYAHGEEELRPAISQGKDVMHTAFEHSLRRKVFVGGLSPTVGSDDLREYFEAKFGPVIEATVVGNQSGGHIQSRGFGFVTFKYEDSVIDAVREHYVTLFGKKVEIKGAIGRSLSWSSDVERTTVLNILRSGDQEMLDLYLSNLSDLAIGPQDEHEVPRMSPADDSDDYEETLQLLQRDHLQSHGASSSSTSIAAPASLQTERGPHWLREFKRWFPAFLGEVSKRLREGEWYPLSSVKADFRATCGMELDHFDLGYQKLSDFIRTMPELCRMKIVPVGRGPATHVVLLPGRRSSPCPASKFQRTTSRIVLSSLVHAGRSYAAAAGHNIPPAVVKTTTPPVQDFRVFETVQHVRNSEHYNQESFRLSLSKEQFDKGTTSVMSPPRNYCDKYASVKSLHGVWQQKRDTENLACLLHSGLDINEHQQVPRQARQPASDDHGIAPSHQVSPESVWRSFPLANSEANFQPPPSPAPATHPVIHDHQAPPFPMHPTSPELTPLAFPAFSTSVSSMLNEEGTCFDPWNFKAFEGCKNLIQEMNLAERYGSEEESPKSTLTSESSQDSTPALSSPSEASTRRICLGCGEEPAVWVALPCAHKTLCTPCKHKLQKAHQSLEQCLLCQGRNREWIAQY